MVKVFVYIPKVKGLNFIGGVMSSQQWYIDRIFSYWIPKIGSQVDYIAYLLT